MPFEEVPESRDHVELFDWLVAEDALEEMLNVIFEGEIVTIDDFFGNHREDMSMYIKNTYGNIRDYIISRDYQLLLDQVKKRCTKCGKNESVSRFVRDNKSFFGMRSHCYECTYLWLFNRRAKSKQLPHNLTHHEKQLILRRFGGACCLTGEKSDVHLDHVIPVSIGHGGTSFGNIIPLRGDLNISKNDRNIFEWFTENRIRFGLSQERFDEVIEWLASSNGWSVGDYRGFVYWCHNQSTGKEDR